MILYNIDYCDLDDYYGYTTTLATFETESERDRAYEWLIQWLYEQYITTKERQTALEENWEYEQASLGAWNRHNHIVQIIRHYRIQLKALSKSTTDQVHLLLRLVFAFTFLHSGGPPYIIRFHG